MKAKISALNKNYLVEFKDDSEFLSFLTQHNDKISDVEVINEEALPELQKPVEVAKPSMSDGWKTLEKSAFTQKEKGVEKKGMTLGGKYAEFKYEPDKNLTNSTDDKVSEPKIDSPALKGEEPKTASVEATAKENEVKDNSPKAEAPKAEDAPKSEETKSEPAKEEKKEEPKEEKSEDKEKKEEVKESVELDESRPDKEDFEEDSLTSEQIEEVRAYFKDLVEDKENYPDYEEMIQAMRSLHSNGSITDEQYNYCLKHWDEWLSEFDPDVGPTEKEEYPYSDDKYQRLSDLNSDKVDEELEEVFKAAGLEEGWKDTAKGALAGLAMTAAVANTNPASANPTTQSSLTSNPAEIHQEYHKPGTEVIKIKGGDGKYYDVKFTFDGEGNAKDEYGEEYTEDQVEDLKNGEDIRGI